MISSKKGQEMSVNVVVGLILGILMLSAGLFLFFRIFHKANITQEEVDKQMEEKIMKILDSGEPIYVPVTNVKSEDGAARFWIGIKNINNEQRDFKVIVDPLDSNPSNFLENSETRIAYLSDYTIPAKDKKSLIVAVDMSGITSKVSLKVVVKVINPSTGVMEDYNYPKIVYIEPK